MASIFVSLGAHETPVVLYLGILQTIEEETKTPNHRGDSGCLVQVENIERRLSDNIEWYTPWPRETVVIFSWYHCMHALQQVSLCVSSTDALGVWVFMWTYTMVAYTKAANAHARDRHPDTFTCQGENLEPCLAIVVERFDMNVMRALSLYFIFGCLDFIPFLRSHTSKIRGWMVSINL